MIGSDLNIGVLYVFAVSSIGAVAILMAGWGSNNKYALLGAFRSVAQLVSYEVPMILALLIPVMLAGSLSMQELVRSQHVWFVFVAPLSALLFLIAAHAENGRAPFALLEAESELVAGYNIEYSGMAFAMFFLAEFMPAFFTSGPRGRIDQLLDLNWKIMVPLALVNTVVMAFLFKLVPTPDYAAAQATASGEFSGVASGLYRLIGPEFVAFLPTALVLLAGNIAMIVGAAAVLRWFSQRTQAAASDTDVADAAVADATSAADASVADATAR